MECGDKINARNPRTILPGIWPLVHNKRHFVKHKICHARWARKTDCRVGRGSTTYVYIYVLRTYTNESISTECSGLSVALAVCKTTRLLPTQYIYPYLFFSEHLPSHTMLHQRDFLVVEWVHTSISNTPYISVLTHTLNWTTGLNLTLPKHYFKSICLNFILFSACPFMSIITDQTYCPKLFPRPMIACPSEWVSLILHSPMDYSHVMRVAGWRLGLKDSVRNRQYFRTRAPLWVPTSLPTLRGHQQSKISKFSKYHS